MKDKVKDYHHKEPSYSNLAARNSLAKEFTANQPSESAN